MATSFVGATGAEANTLSMPSHQASDLIIGMATRYSSSVIPTLPAGWFYLAERANVNRCAVYGFRLAANSSETFGTWTNAELVAVGVWRDGTNFIVPGAYAGYSQASGTVCRFEDLLVNTAANISKQRASSWVAGFAGSSLNSLAIETPPTGMTNRVSVAGASVGEIAIHDTNGDVTWATQTVTLGSASALQTFTVELWDTGISKAAGGSVIVIEDD